MTLTPSVVGSRKSHEAYTKLGQIVLDRRDWGRSKLRNLRLTQIRKRNRNLDYTVLAGLRDLVASLKACAPGAKRPDIATLAGAIFNCAISVEQVKQAGSS